MSSPSLVRPTSMCRLLGACESECAFAVFPITHSCDVHVPIPWCLPIRMHIWRLPHRSFVRRPCADSPAPASQNAHLMSSPSSNVVTSMCRFPGARQSKYTFDIFPIVHSCDLHVLIPRRLLPWAKQRACVVCAESYVKNQLGYPAPSSGRASCVPNRTKKPAGLAWAKQRSCVNRHVLTWEAVRPGHRNGVSHTKFLLAARATRVVMVVATSTRGRSHPAD